MQWKYGCYRPHKRAAIVCSGGRTRQEFAEECDINVIMRRYQTHGLLPPNGRQMQYGDFVDMPDFLDAMNTVARANEAFAALPAHVRKRFSNDPAEFCDFVSDPENIDEVRKLGLAKAPEKGPAPPSGGHDGAEPGPPSADGEAS